MTKKYLVSVVENICCGPGAARSVKRLQVCSPCSALAPNLGPAVGCWRLVTATIQPPEPEPERERAIVTVITNAGNIKCIIFTQLVILDHLWFWPWFINRLSQLLNWRNMYVWDWFHLCLDLCFFHLRNIITTNHLRIENVPFVQYKYSKYQLFLHWL